MSKKYNLSKRNLKQGSYFDQDDINSLIRRKNEDYENYNLSEVEMPASPTNGRPTTNRWDLGRNCPFCAGRLVTHDHTITADEDLHLLRCTACGKRVYASDINDIESITTEMLYRNISDRTFKKWEEHIKTRSKKI